MLNKIILMGRLTRDPEYRATATGLSVANFSVAVDRDITSQGGEKETDFIDCVAWRKTAEFITKYFTKGALIVVCGRLQIRSWTDKEGNKRRASEVIVDNAYFGGSKRDGESAGASRVGSYSAPVTPAPSEFAVLDDDDAQLPF